MSISLESDIDLVSMLVGLFEMCGIEESHALSGCRKELFYNWNLRFDIDELKVLCITFLLET